MDERQRLIDLIQRDQEKFYRMAFAYVKNRDDALDAVHNAIVNALQKQHGLRRPEYLNTWFCRILINESISILRKNRRTLYIDEIAELKAANAEDDSGLQAQRIDLYDAIEKLPIKLRTIIILRYFENMKLSDIAEITSSSLSTTKSRLYRALELLKIDLEDIENA